MHFLPEARYTNETMHGRIFRDAVKVKALKALKRVWKANHMDMTDIVEMLTASKVVVETVDRKRPLWVESEGEVKGRTKVTMEGMPRGLEVFVPTISICSSEAD